MKKRLWKLQPKMCGALLLGVISFPTFAEEGNYLNLYCNGSTQSILIDDIDKIVFNDGEISVKQVNDVTVSVLYNDFIKFTFGEKEDIGAVDEINNYMDSSLLIYYQSINQDIVVESSLPIETIGIYNLQGHLMQQLLPRVETLSLSINDYPSGVYIIYVNNGETVKTQKIIKH